MSSGDAAFSGVDLTRAAFADLRAFSADDHVTAWRAFHDSCDAVARNAPELRRARPPTRAFHAVCEAALALGADIGPAQAHAFFERHFTPHRIEPENSAFFTAYYRPEVAASLTRTAEFSEPLLARPEDLVTLQPGEAPASLQNLSSARRRPDGALEPYPTRPEIEAGALGDRAKPVAFVVDAIEAFMIHVQGSARLVLADGRKLDLTYAGRNGHPYTSIGKILIEAGEIALPDMSLARLKTWVRGKGQKLGETGRALLHRNKSFVFFSAALADEAAPGPVGAAGLPLTPHRSVAVDRSLWSYGLPFWIETTIPWRGVEAEPYARLMIAQDTGSAIVGPARADLYFGTGGAAGERAGGVRHHGRMFVLLPRDDAP